MVVSLAHVDLTKATLCLSWKKHIEGKRISLRTFIGMMRYTIAILLLALLRRSGAYLRETMTGPYTGYEYAFYSEDSDNVHYDEAAFKCKYYGYTGLVMIKTIQIQEEVRELMDAFGSTRESYIGMLDKYTEGYWFWDDGTEVVDYFQDWQPGEPNNSNGEDCGVFQNEDFKWNDEDCDHNYGYICATPPSSCTTRDIPISKRQYLIRDAEYGQVTLAIARQSCKESGLRLAVVESDEVLMKIKRSKDWDATSGYWVDGHINSCLNSDSCLGLNKYICEAVLPNGVQLNSKTTDYNVGDTIKIECSSFGLPVPEVTWHKDAGDELTKDVSRNTYQRPEPGKSTLVIQSARVEDASKYRCFATNEIDGQSNKHKTFLDIRVHTSTAVH